MQISRPTSTIQETAPQPGAQAEAQETNQTTNTAPTHGGNTQSRATTAETPRDTISLRSNRGTNQAPSLTNTTPTLASPNQSRGVLGKVLGSLKDFISKFINIQ